MTQRDPPLKHFYKPALLHQIAFVYQIKYLNSAELLHMIQYYPLLKHFHMPALLHQIAFDC